MNPEEKDFDPDDIGDATPETSREYLEEEAAAREAETPSTQLPEVPQEVEAMQGMASEPEPDQLAPAEAPQMPESADPSVFETPIVGQEFVPPAEVEAMESMASEPAAMGDAPTGPSTQTQFEQVRQSIGTQKFHQFEMDYGAPEVSAAGMEEFEAQARYLDVDFMWKRLMTMKYIDLSHQVEQLIAMMERER